MGISLGRFRKNVAALMYHKGEYLGCFREKYQSWQCVQGGIEDFDGSPRDAIIREIHEELGLSQNNFQIHYQSHCWRRYRFTPEMLKRQEVNKYIGQEQMWFLVELFTRDGLLQNATHIEFDRVDFLSFSLFYQKYAPWKKGPFADFCAEVNLYHA